MIVTLLLKIVIYGVVFMRSRAVNHNRKEPTNQPSYDVTMTSNVKTTAKIEQYTERAKVKMVFRYKIVETCNFQGVFAYCSK